MPNDVFDLLRDAIRTKRNVSATYRGRYREVSPHAIGYKDGVAHLIANQFGGESSTGLSPDPAENWRCMDVDLLANVMSIGGEWQTASNHSRPNTCIDDIVEEVVH